MSNLRLRTRPDGYKLCTGGALQSSFHAVKKRSDFIRNNLEDGTLVLDVGCGLGIYFDSLSMGASRVVGIDINQDYLREAIQNAESKTAVVQASVEELPFKRGSFDVVVMIEVLEHIPKDRNALKEVSRVLSPRGKLIITAPNKWFPFETHGIRVGSKVYGFPLSLSMPFLPYLPSVLRRLLTQARVYSRCNLSKLLIMNGFQIRKTDFLTPSLDVPERKAHHIPKVYVLLRRLFNLLESTFLKRLAGSTVIICAEKV